MFFVISTFNFVKKDGLLLLKFDVSVVSGGVNIGFDKFNLLVAKNYSSRTS